ncbi:MAG: MotA/TolQ/ExbB proton channel family protein [Deltaproteobacteria bacterium]|nr:MotA/TolQ/ExbB proton channel family protein [Deltaproteobacteria bacterium]MBK8718810.1 MotA/TolQ/ExbB proton channel family protein [Deltaproteobacteria bacterium]MBP7286528.1 MotA/TolQ/ExbB proton channel family protein [Nannocystaceae bacterium]
MDVKELFGQGGPLMWAILGSSIIGVAFFIERLWSLQRARLLPRAFVDRIRGLVVKRKTSEALLLCEENRSSIALIMAAGLRAYGLGRGRDVVKESVEEVGEREVARMGRNVEIVGTVAAVSPLLGLLGTVVGMIQVFKKFVDAYKQGMVGPDAFAEGIWQALITTAYGLVVAIPMLVLYKFLQGRNERIVIDMEEDAMGLVDLLDDAALHRDADAARSAKDRDEAPAKPSGTKAKADADEDAP